jgi:radical SAM superfamily enzyme YgiQ (UPF0313 family)
MKIILASATYSTFITFNRRFLGLGYIHAYCLDDPQIANECEIVHNFYETMHGDLAAIAAEIAGDKPDVVAFACYVWNTPDVLKICAHLKRLDPKILTVLGGPEVSYHYVRILEANPAVDFIVVGEGEDTFRELLQYKLNGAPAIETINGLTYRDEAGKARANPARAFQGHLDRFPSPYLTGVLGVDDLTGGAYFQTTRGCPFTCTYCDYGRNQPYYEFSMERVAAEFDYFKDAGARVFFCADATFNYKRNRANDILQLAIDRGLEAMLWIEVFPSLINDELVAQLGKVKRVFCGVGIQTTNPVTMKNIHRVWKPEMITEKLDRIAKLPNCFLGLELIMGLPGDDLKTFKETLNWSYARNANQIFALNLQILPRTPLEGEVEKYSIKTLGDDAGREIVSNCTFNEREILIGKAITSWHRLFQPVFARLAKINGRAPGDLLEGWAFRSYEAGLYDHMEDYHHNIIKPEIFDPLQRAFSQFMAEVLHERDAVALADLLTDFFRYIYVRRAMTREGAFVSDIFDLNCITFRPKDHRILSAVGSELPAAGDRAVPDSLRPRKNSEVRYETYRCDMRDLWPLETLEEWRAIPRREVVYAVYTEPKTGAGRTVIVDDAARRAIDAIDGTRTLAQIAATIGRESGYLVDLYALLSKAGLAGDADAPLDANAFKVGLHSTAFATYF